MAGGAGGLAVIRVGPDHLQAVTAFLRAHLLDAMFPLSNLAAHGLGGDHRNGTRLWADDPADPGAVLGRTRAGMALPVWNDAPQGARDVLRGARLIGIAGAAAAVSALRRATGLTEAPAMLEGVEPQFRLSLDALRLPSGPGLLAPLSHDRARAIDWRMAYDAELHLGRTDRETAAQAVDGYIAADSHRFLVVDGVPTAMTGFNARLPEIVQIGGVYVPPEGRGRGSARRAVGLHLAQARDASVTQATLFAASETAARTYRALGFARSGTYMLLLFDGPQEVT